MKEEYLTTSQAAILCNVTRFTIRNWVNSGKLKSTKTAGGHRRIYKDALVEFMNANQIVEIGKKEIQKKSIVKEVQKKTSAQHSAVPKGLLHGGLYHTGKYVGFIKRMISKKNEVSAA